MYDKIPSFYSLALLNLLTILQLILFIRNKRFGLSGSLQILWIIIIIITIAEWVAFLYALWMLAFLSFYLLREFLSLADIRLEDRWGILLSYLAIPFMFYLIQIEWYGFFIIAIPVYTFLLMPFFVALGGKSRGIVFSVGVLDFGLFFYVFCLGHLAYLIYFSERMALLVILIISIADYVFKILYNKHFTIHLAVSIVITIPICFISSDWSGIPIKFAVFMGILLPLLARIGQFTLKEFEKDLMIRPDRLRPGRGKYIEAVKLYLFTVPIAFHYLRWLLKF